MGYNIEQYELNDNNSYNQFLGIGSGKVKKALGIGDGKIFGKVVNPTKNAEYEANKNTSSSEEVTEVPKIAPSSTTPEAKNLNTIMYIGIGVGVLVIGIVAIILIKRK
jgi:hypothetical protein